MEAKSTAIATEQYPQLDAIASREAGIVIVGAGPAGLVAALSLAQAGLKVRTSQCCEVVILTYMLRRAQY